VTDTYAYDAYGNSVAQAGSTQNEFQYRGEQHDLALQMYYLRARYYIPGIGRFLTQDKFERHDFSTRTGMASMIAYASGQPVPLLGAESLAHRLRPYRMDQPRRRD